MRGDGFAVHDHLGLALHDEVVTGSLGQRDGFVRRGSPPHRSTDSRPPPLCPCSMLARSSAARLRQLPDKSAEWNGAF